MARQTAISINTIPIGPLGIIGMPGCEELTDKIESTSLNGAKLKQVSMLSQLLSLAIREIHIKLMYLFHVLAAAKARVLLTKA